MVLCRQEMDLVILVGRSRARIFGDSVKMPRDVMVSAVAERGPEGGGSISRRGTEGSVRVGAQPVHGHCLLRDKSLLPSREKFKAPRAAFPVARSEAVQVAWDSSVASEARCGTRGVTLHKSLY